MHVNRKLYKEGIIAVYERKVREDMNIELLSRRASEFLMEKQNNH